MDDSNDPTGTGGSPGIRVERAAVDGTCPNCGHDALRAYPVLSEGGWFQVVKCQECLTSVSREAWKLLGPVSLTSEGLSLR